jgi:hypothetical protein
MWALAPAGDRFAADTARFPGPPVDPQPRTRIVAASRSPQPSIGLDRGRRALGDVRAHECHGRRYEPVDIFRLQLPHLHERIHPAGEENFRLVDVPDPGDRRLVEQCVSNVGVAARADAPRGLLRREALRQRVRAELANLRRPFKHLRRCELGDRDVERNSLDVFRLQNDAHAVVGTTPSLVRTVDVP